MFLAELLRTPVSGVASILTQTLSWAGQAGIKAKSKMSKAEKMRQKKDKAKNFNGAGDGAAAKKVQKNAKRWQ